MEQGKLPCKSDREDCTKPCEPHRTGASFQLVLWLHIKFVLKQEVSIIIFGFVPQKVTRKKPLMISTPRVPNQKVVPTARKYNTPHHFVWSPLVNYIIIIILINLHTCDFHTHTVPAILCCFTL